MKQEQEVQAQLCPVEITQKEHTWAVHLFFSPSPRKPHLNLDPPLKDNWLTRLPHHLPLLSEQE